MKVEESTPYYVSSGSLKANERKSKINKCKKMNPSFKDEINLNIKLKYMKNRKTYILRDLDATDLDVFHSAT